MMLLYAFPPLIFILQLEEKVVVCRDTNNILQLEEKEVWDHWWGVNCSKPFYHVIDMCLCDGNK